MMLGNKINRLLLLTSFFYALILLITFHNVQAFKQLDIHIHGEIELNIVIEGNRVYLELESPAINLIGFEHPPQNESDHKLIEDTQQYLGTAKWFNLSSASLCQLRSSKVQNTFSIDKESHKEDHHDDHEHGEAHDKTAQHAEFTAQFEYQCKDIKELKSIQVMLFTDYPNVHKITTNLITSKQQNRFSLSKHNTKISLD